MLLNIFSGIEILFFVLGVLTTLGVVGLIFLGRSYQLDWKAWSSLGLGALLLIFALAWSVSSVLEGEPRAASMGMVFFGMPGIIFGLLGRRFVLQGNAHK